MALAAAMTFIAASSPTDRAQAMPLGNSSSIRSALDELSLIDHVQYYYGGRRYCWYDGGWNGPGWYRCGQYLVPGIGWGGGVGWRGWAYRGGVGRVGVGRVGVGRVGRVGVGRVGGGRVGGGRHGGGRVGGGRVGGGRHGVGGSGGRGGGGRGGGGGRRSDITLKHDVALLGHLDNGLGYYRFSYNGSDKVFVGVMAQEVQMVVPEAVTRGNDGKLRVFYDKLGLKFQTYDQWRASGAHVPAGAPVRH
jgi:hypothetical protein